MPSRPTGPTGRRTNGVCDGSGGAKPPTPRNMASRCPPPKSSRCGRQAGRHRTDRLIVGLSVIPAGFGVAPQPRGLTPIGRPASRGAWAPGVAARLPPLPASESRRNPEGLRPSAGTAQPWGVSPRGRGSTAAPAGFGVAPQPRGLTPIGWHGPAVGRQPPGSRLDCHPCPLRGRAATPRAYAHRLARPITACQRGTTQTPALPLAKLAAGHGSRANTKTHGAVR